jgi:hypothetical protein
MAATGFRSQTKTGNQPIFKGVSTSTPRRIIDLLKNARQPMWLISVNDQLHRLSSEKGSHHFDTQMELF